MKKTFILLTLLCLTLSANATETPQKATVSDNARLEQKYQMQKMRRDLAFERRLGLTEVQKLKARKIREKGHEDLRPVIEQIKTKKQEAEMVRRSRIAVQIQEERLTAIDNELRILEKKAQEIRKANMKEFESILTREQKRTLKNMKKEGRKKYQQAHPISKPGLPPFKESFQHK